MEADLWTDAPETRRGPGRFQLSGPVQPRFGEVRPPFSPDAVGSPPLCKNPRAEELWQRIFGHKSRVAYFKQVYGTFQPKDLELDDFMLADALEVFGKTSAAKSIGYGLDVLLDLVLSCKPYLLQAERNTRTTTCCVACNDPLFSSGPISETAGGVVICDVCNAWAHLGDPLNGYSCSPT